MQSEIIHHQILLVLSCSDLPPPCPAKIKYRIKKMKINLGYFIKLKMFEFQDKGTLRITAQKEIYFFLCKCRAVLHHTVKRPTPLLFSHG